MMKKTYYTVIAIAYKNKEKIQIEVIPVNKKKTF